MKRTQQRAKLRLAADERARPGSDRRRTRALERGVLREHRALEILERSARLDPQLLDKGHARVAVDVQRFGLAPRAVEREHQLATQPLAERMARAQRLELCHELRRLAAAQVGLQPVLERLEPQLLEPGRLRLGKRLVREVGQRRAAPQRKGVAEQPRGGGRVTHRQRLAPFTGKPLESMRIDLLRVHAQQVAGRARDNRVRPQQLAQPRDVDVHRLDGRLGQILSPQLVDEPVGGDELVGIHQQDRQQGTLSHSSERERPGIAAHLQRAEDPEIHHEALGRR